MQALYGYVPTISMDVPRTDSRPRTASILHELTSQRVEPLHTNHILQTDIVRIIRIHQFRIHPVYIRIQPVYVWIQPVHIWIYPVYVWIQPVRIWIQPVYLWVYPCDVLWVIVPAGVLYGVVVYGVVVYGAGVDMVVE